MAIASATASFFRSSIVAALVAYANEIRVDCTPWFIGLRIGAEAFNAASEPPRISYSDACCVLQRGLLALPGSGHGLTIGGRQSLANFGVLGLAMLAEPTFGSALHTGIRYAPISGAMLELSLADDPAGVAVVLRMRSHAPLLEVYLCEELVSSCLKLCRALLGDGFNAERIEFAYPPPAYAERYAQLLDTRILFNRPDTRVVIGHTWLGAPMPAANPDTARQLNELCRAQMPLNSTSKSMREVIEQRLTLQPAHAPKLAELAAELHITERTLRRHLQTEGTSYREILERVRERIARQLLREQTLTLVQIATAVGFADPRDFRRAFKRWTGALPSQLRHTTPHSLSGTA